MGRTVGTMALLGLMVGVGAALLWEERSSVAPVDTLGPVLVAAEPASPSAPALVVFKATALDHRAPGGVGHVGESPRFGWLAARIAQEFGGRCGVVATLERDRVILSKLALRHSVFVRARGPTGNATTVFCDGRILERSESGADFVSHPVLLPEVARASW